MAKHHQQQKTKSQPIKPTHVPSSTAKPFIQNPLFWLLAILVAAFIVLSPIQKGSFTNYDDDIYITENPMIRNLDGEQVSRLFTGYYLNQYSPVAMLVMGLEFKISDDPAFIKIMSILVHLLAVFILYKLLAALFHKPEYIIIPVALFALHPVQVESVAWAAAAMKIGAYAVFFLASLLFYTKYLDKKRSGYFFISLALFLLSCFSKEQAIALPITLLGIDYLKGRSFRDKKLWIEKISFLVLSIVFAIVTLKASTVNVNKLEVTYSLFERLLIANYSLFSYIWKLLVPVNLSAFYTYPLPKEIDSKYYLTLLGLILLIYGLCISFKKGQKIIVFGILFFLVNISLPTVSLLIGARDVMMADRYLYIPSISIFILLAFMVVYLKERFKISSSFLYAACIAYTLFLGANTYSRTKVWNNSISVFSDVIEKGNQNGTFSPYLSLSFNNRGIALKNEGKLDAALKDYEMAIKINPKDPKSYVNKGNIFFTKQNPASAIEEYNKALALDSNLVIGLSSRGAAYGMLGKYDEALIDFNRCIKLAPNARHAYLNRSLLYFNTGKYKEALDDINKHLENNWSDYNAIGQRGFIYFKLGELNEALNNINMAINHTPKPGSLYMNRSLVYKEMGNKNAALQDALKAKENGIRVSDEYVNELK